MTTGLCPCQTCTAEYCRLCQRVMAGSAIVDTKLLPLTQRTLHTAIFAFKCIHEMVPHRFNNYSKVIQPKYSTRNSKFKLMVPRTKLKFAERSFYARR